MERLPRRFTERVSKNLKAYQGITENQRKRDVSEADTVTVVKDILARAKIAAAESVATE
jgi:hypothetical protein